eukprot:gene3033-13058_t
MTSCLPHTYPITASSSGATVTRPHPVIISAQGVALVIRLVASPTALRCLPYIDSMTSCLPHTYPITASSLGATVTRPHPVIISAQGVALVIRLVASPTALRCLPYIDSMTSCLPHTYPITASSSGATVTRPHPVIISAQGVALVIRLVASPTALRCLPYIDSMTSCLPHTYPITASSLGATVTRPHPVIISAQGVALVIRLVASPTALRCLPYIDSMTSCLPHTYPITASSSGATVTRPHPVIISAQGVALVIRLVASPTALRCLPYIDSMTSCLPHTYPITASSSGATVTRPHPVIISAQGVALVIRLVASPTALRCLPYIDSMTSCLPHTYPITASSSAPQSRGPIQ